jgi:drug/metabolite transporter (DMT)-like permease
MSLNYWFGIACAIVAGALNALGVLLQKKAVNRVVSRSDPEKFTSKLLREPLWLVGLGVNVVLGSVMNVLAQKSIGPVLVPGLSASGLILLALGSARLLGEKLTIGEWLGILVLVFGMTLLGFSNLAISSGEMDLLDSSLQFRFLAFIALLGLGWAASWLLACRSSEDSRGKILAASSGIPFSISNLLVMPIILSAGPVLTGTASGLHIRILLVSLLVLLGVNVFGIWQTQLAFRFTPANKVMPIQAIPVQIAPIMIFLFIFQKSFLDVSLLIAPLGIILILTGGFLLGRRSQSLEPLT